MNQEGRGVIGINSVNSDASGCPMRLFGVFMAINFDNNLWMNCGSCGLKYNLAQRRPIISSCYHTICQSCRVALQQCPKCNKLMDKNQWNLNDAIMEVIKDTKNSEGIPIAKIIFVGESAAGKSSLIRRLVGEQFSQKTQSSLGIDYRFAYRYREGKGLRFKLIDTVGQQRYQSIFQSCYKEADMVVIVYDARNQRKASVDQWQHKVEQACRKNIPVFYVANKIDLEEAQAVVESDYPISCKMSLGLDSLWKAIFEKAQELSLPIDTLTQRTIRITSKKVAQTKKNCIC